LVKKIIRDLREHGEVKRAILGVSIREVSNEIAADLDLPAVEGVFVSDVNEGSSAAEAGLQMNDVIVGINGIKTGSVPELQEQVARFRPGDTVSLEIIRYGKKLRKDNVRLKEMPKETDYRR
jgi:S1-C subfamily serine protease